MADDVHAENRDRNRLLFQVDALILERDALAAQVARVRQYATDMHDVSRVLSEQLLQVLDGDVTPPELPGGLR